MLISVEGTGENQLDPRQDRILQGCYTVLFQEILKQKWPVRWSIVVKEKSAIGFLLFGECPSDRILKATKDVNTYFFIHSFTVSLMQQFLYIEPNFHTLLHHILGPIYKWH
jgi:hypothetical protein